MSGQQFATGMWAEILGAHTALLRLLLRREILQLLRPLKPTAWAPLTTPPAPPPACSVSAVSAWRRGCFWTLPETSGTER